MTALLDAWQAALAAEHQAVFGYDLLGPYLSPADQQLAVTCSNAHEAVRDATSDALAAAGQTPVAAEPDYPTLYGGIPQPVGGATGARRLAVRLEEACAGAWRYLYLQAASASGAPASALRGRAQANLTASAVQAARWRALVTPSRATAPFPGT